MAQGTGRVLLMGRITAVKGGAVLIPALRSAGQALNRVLHLTVGGDGPEVDALRELARREGVDAEFLGWLGTGELGALYRSAELLAVPSLWPEPFGLVGIEAGSVGLPAVAFAVGGIPDWLIPGVSGECATGSRPTVAALSAAIVRAVRDPDHYAALRRGALADGVPVHPRRASEGARAGLEARGRGGSMPLTSATPGGGSGYSH